MRKHKSGHNDNALDVIGTGTGSHSLRKLSDNGAYVIGGTSADFRPRMKSEYVHSAQARIP